MSNKLTTKYYWDSTYKERAGIVPVDVVSWRNIGNKKIYKLMLKYGIGDGPVLEMGGGSSAWLAFLVKEFPNTEFSCLDFSEEGIASLAAWKRAHGVRNLEVVLGDFFSAHEEMGKFDFVYSQGVVEHFSELSKVLVAHSAYLSDSGKMLTLIPNMAGVLGLLTKWMDRTIYDIHVPHDLDSFVKGHMDAGLSVVEAGYLGSNNFGVLSSCVRDRKIGLRLLFYKVLVGLGLGVWFFEDRVLELPSSKMFSPYIYVVSERVRESL